jgi:hypothetical protein
VIFSKTFNAVVATVLFACTLGVLVAVGMFGAVRVFEQMGEGLGFLPNRWAENNLILMIEIAGVAALPVALWFVAWFYRKAQAAEEKLKDYKYVPPAATSGKS